MSRGRSCTVNHSYFNSIQYEKQAYWLGFLAADGSVFIEPKRSSGVQLELERGDNGHVRLFATTLGSTYAIMDVSRVAKSGKITYSTATRVISKPMVEDLARYHITPRKTFTVRSPSLPRPLMRHYWRGVIDGDGCLTHKEGKPCLSLAGNPTIQNEFRRYVQEELGFCISLNRYGTYKNGDPMFLAAAQNKKGIAIAAFLYRNCTVALARKDALATEWTGRRHTQTLIEAAIAASRMPLLPSSSFGRAA